MTGRPRLFHNFAVMGVRVFSERVATTILAVEPMMVPLPPKPAPKASAHHNGANIHAGCAQSLDDRDHGDGDRDVVHDRRKPGHHPDDDHAKQYGWDIGRLSSRLTSRPARRPLPVRPP